MLFIPAFELGLWNAWIFILPFFLLPFIGDRLIKKINMESISEYISEFSKRGKILLLLLMIPIFWSYIYSIFLPFKLGTIWFYIGSGIYLVGLFIQIIAWYDLATAPVDKPVTNGLYRISRNPMYIGDFFIYISVSIACLSWVFLIVVLISIVVNYIAVTSEERECLKKYGDKFLEYMERVPRWIGRPKSAKR